MKIGSVEGRPSSLKSNQTSDTRYQYEPKSKARPYWQDSSTPHGHVVYPINQEHKQPMNNKNDMHDIKAGGGTIMGI